MQGLYLFTKANANSYDMPWFLMRYAMTTEALREIPLRGVRGRVARGGRGEAYLLAMHKHVLPCRERLFDPCANVVEMGLEVSRGDVHDVDPCDGHAWVVDRGKPWDVDDLDEVGDAVFPEEISVGDGSERAEPEVAEMLGGRREEDLVHWGAHRLDDFLRDVVEPDHLSLCPLLLAPRLALLPLLLSILINHRRSPASRGLDPSRHLPAFHPLFGHHA